METGQSPFLDSLRQKQEEVFQRLEDAHLDERLAKFVFNLLLDLASEPDARLSEAIISTHAQALRIAEQLTLPLRGSIFSLSELLLNVDEDPQLITLLFVQGYWSLLQEMGPVERREFSLKLVSLLPGVERLGPFVFSDYVDLVCDKEDALRFWQIYVDRVSLEISRRSRQISEAGSTDSWIFARLLRFHEQGPSPGRGGVWFTLKQHVNRILRSRWHRWRFLRSLMESCHDPRMLHYLCISAAARNRMLLSVLLTRGDSKLISCGLFIIQIQGAPEGLIDEVLSNLSARSLPEVGERLVDLYAQCFLPEHPLLSLSQLSEGLLSLIRDQARQGASLESLLRAVSHDVRAMRQVLLLADLPIEDDPLEPSLLHPLQERVIATFFQSFTPKGIDHILNDSKFHEAVLHALQYLAVRPQGELFSQLESFAGAMESLVYRWVEEGEGRRRRLFGRLLGQFSYIILQAARRLYAQLESREAGLWLYRLMVRLFAQHSSVADTAGWAGSLEQMLPALFPDLLKELREERIDMAAELLAEEEQAQDQLRPETLGPLQLESPGLFLRRRPSRDHPLSSEARLLRSTPLPMQGLFSLFFERLKIFLGQKRRGQLIFTDHEFLFREELQLRGETLEHREYSQLLIDLKSLRIYQGLRHFYRLLGATALSLSGLMGGYLLFSGLRGRSSLWSGYGLGILLLGICLDLVSQWMSRRNQSFVFVDLRFEGGEQLSLALDRLEGAEILDLLMTHEVERKELEQRAGWVEVDQEWEALSPLSEGEDS